MYLAANISSHIFIYYVEDTGEVRCDRLTTPSSTALKSTDGRVGEKIDLRNNSPLLPFACSCSLADSRQQIRWVFHVKNSTHLHVISSARGNHFSVRGKLIFPRLCFGNILIFIFFSNVGLIYQSHPSAQPQGDNKGNSGDLIKLSPL